MCDRLWNNPDHVVARQRHIGELLRHGSAGEQVARLWCSRRCDTRRPARSARAARRRHCTSAPASTPAISPIAQIAGRARQPRGRATGVRLFVGAQLTQSFAPIDCRFCGSSKSIVTHHTAGRSSATCSHRLHWRTSPPVGHHTQTACLRVVSRDTQRVPGPSRTLRICPPCVGVSPRLVENKQNLPRDVSAETPRRGERPKKKSTMPPQAIAGVCLSRRS